MEKDIKILDLYTNSKNGVVVTYLKESKKYIKEFPVKWYFVITEESYATKHDKLMKLKDEYHYGCIKYKTDTDKWIRVYCNYNSKEYILNQFKKWNIDTFEADLQPDRRFWIDNDLKVAEPEDFKLLYIDIEVDDSVDGLRIGKDRIISYSAAGSNGRKYFFTSKDEKEVLQHIITTVKKYDIVIGWNSMKYDIPFIKERCKLHNLFFPRICHIDMMQRMIHAYRFDTSIKSFSLNAIAMKFLGTGKVARTGKIIELYENDFDTFVKYSMTDVLLLKQLNDKFSVITMLLKQAKWCNVVPRTLGQTGSGLYTLLDTVILKATHKRNQKGMTPMYSYDELKEMSESNPEQYDSLDYAGGLVLEPKLGLYENVYVFDFKTLYPSIMLTSNIGFDTLNQNGDIKNPSGYCFDSEPQSILAEVLTDLLTKRKEYKELKLKLIEEGKKGTPEHSAVEANEVIAKELANSVYGIMGAKWGRYFATRGVVESITLMGQWLLKSMETFFSKKGFTIITGDTDSILIATDTEIDKEQLLKEYHEYLEDRMRTELGIKKSWIQLNFDKYFTKFIIVAKKNYAGILTNQEGRIVNYTFVRGLSSVKSDTCKIVSDLTKELLNSLLTENRDIEYYKKWIEDKKQSVFENITIEDISIHKKIRRNINEYKKTLPLSANIAKNKFGNESGFLLHTEVEYIVTGRKVKEELVEVDTNGMTTKQKNRLRLKDNKYHKIKKTNTLDGIHVDEYDGNFDKSYYWNNLIIPNMSRLLEVVFADVDWSKMKYDTKKTNQTSLFDYI